MSFDTQLAVGQLGESQIAMWLRRRGHHVLPVYEKERGQGVGPRIFAADGTRIVAPDMLTFHGHKATWVEAKHKEAFTWHRLTGRWVTGIDLNHYAEYQRLLPLTKWPIWLLFLHRGGQAKDSPPSPSGLYGNTLHYLMDHENHTHQNHGRHGMVYWAERDLKKLADYPLEAP